MSDVELQRGDTLRFDPPLVAGPDPHLVSIGRVVWGDRYSLAIKLPGQRELFRCLRSDLPWQTVAA